MKLLNSVRIWLLMRLIGDSPVAANLTIRGELDVHGQNGLIMNNYIDGTDYQEKESFRFKPIPILLGAIVGAIVAIYLFKP